MDQITKETRAARLTVRFTEEEYTLMFRAANRAQRSMSDVIRIFAVRQARKDEATPTVPREGET